MTKEQQTRLAKHLMRLLKVRYISFPIAKTEKGDVFIRYTKDVEEFEIVMDAVPLDEEEENTKELRKVLDRYVFEEEEIINIYRSPLESLATEEKFNGIIDSNVNSTDTTESGK